MSVRDELPVPVILAGGVGTRLWPVSRADRPKQFQALAGDMTLFQETVRRVADKARFAPPLIVTGTEYLHTATQQLREIGVAPSRIIVEPEGRNTAPAITIAALVAKEQALGNSLVVMPSDHLVRDAARLGDAIQTACTLADVENVLVTFGITPDGPETGYGYIRRGAPLASAFQVAEFTEKPDSATAERMVGSGDYLWNSGMFVFPLSAFLEGMQAAQPEILRLCREALDAGSQVDEVIRPAADAFGAVEKISVDYALLERAARVAVVPVDPGWSDVGSWTAVWEASERDDQGNAVHGDAVTIGSKGCYVRSDGMLTATVGLENVIVVATEDAVLVAAKSAAQDVRALVQELEQRGRGEATGHARVYRPWGSFASLEQGPGFQVKRITVAPGQKLSLQYHHHRAEHWTVVAGTARVTVDDTVQDLQANESVFIPLGAVHRLENPGDDPVEVIEVQCGDYLGEDDIVRLEDTYGRSDRGPAAES